MLVCWFERGIYVAKRWKRTVTEVGGALPRCPGTMLMPRADVLY